MSAAAALHELEKTFIPLFVLSQDTSRLEELVAELLEGPEADLVQFLR